MMADGKFKRLCVRTLSGAIYVALIVLATLYPVVMLPLMCLLTMVGLVEFFRMEDAQNLDVLSRDILLGLTGVIYLMFLFGRFNLMFPIGNYQLFHYLIVTFVILAVLALFRKRDHVFQTVGNALFAMFWIVLPLALMTRACLFEESGGLVLFTFVLIWVNDTFAYLGGSLYGRHKMIERISPNKTWEGTVTGFVATMGASVLAGSLWADKIIDGATFHWYGWLLFGLAVSLMATLGDLLESLLKRQAGVKDSGKIMPGHGGVLDRMDSILLAIYPVLFVLSVLLIL